MSTDDEMSTALAPRHPQAGEPRVVGAMPTAVCVAVPVPQVDFRVKRTALQCTGASSQTVVLLRVVTQRGNSGAGNLGNFHWEFQLEISPIPQSGWFLHHVCLCVYMYTVLVCVLV